jgi:hypothetical protein
MFQASKDYNVLTFNPKWNATFNFSLPCAKPVLKTYLDRHPTIFGSSVSSSSASSLSLSDSEYEGLCKALLLFWSGGIIEIEIYDGERFNEEIFMGKVTLLISSFHPLIKKITELEMKGNYSLEKIKPIQRVSGTISLVAYLHIPEKKYLEDQIITMLKQNEIASRLIIEQQRLNSKGPSSAGIRGSTPNRRSSAVPAPSAAFNNKGKGVNNSRSSYPLNNYYDDSGVDSFQDQNDIVDDSYGGNESSSSEIYNKKQQNQSKKNSNSNKRSTYGGPIPLPSSSLRGSSPSPAPSSFQQNNGNNKKISGFMKSFASKAIQSQDEADILLSGESGDEDEEQEETDEDAVEDYRRYQANHNHQQQYQQQQHQQNRYTSPSSSSRPVTAGGSVPSSSSANQVRKPLSFNPNSGDRPSTAPATTSPHSPPISSLDEIRNHSNIHVSSLVDRESLLESKITKRNFLSDMSKQLNGLEKMQENTEKVVNNLSKQLQAKKVSQIIDTSVIHHPSLAGAHVSSFSTPPVPLSSSSLSKPSKSPASADSSLSTMNQHSSRPSLRPPPHQPPPPPPQPSISSSSSAHVTPNSAAVNSSSSSSTALKRRATLSLGLKELQSQVNQAVTSLEQFLEIPLIDPEEDKTGKRSPSHSALKGKLGNKSRESISESEFQLSKSSSLSPSKKKSGHNSTSFHSHQRHLGGDDDSESDREMYEEDENNQFVKEKTHNKRIEHHADDDDEFLIDEDDDFNEEENRNEDDFENEDVDRNGDQLIRKKSEYDNNKYLEKRVSVRDLYNQHVYKYHNPDSPHSPSFHPPPFSSDVLPSSSASKQKPPPPPTPPRPASLNKDGNNANRLNQRIDSDDSESGEEKERFLRSASKTSNRSSSNDNQHHTHYPSSSPATSAYRTPSKEEPPSHRVPHNTPATTTLGNGVFEGNRSLSQSDIDELSQRVKQLSRMSFSSTDGTVPSIVPPVPSIPVSRTKSTDSFSSFASSPSKTKQQVKSSSPQKIDKISKIKIKILSFDFEDDYEIEEKKGRTESSNVPVQRLSKKNPVALNVKTNNETQGGRLVISASSSMPSDSPLSPLADSPGKTGTKRSPRLETSIPKLTPRSKEKVVTPVFLSPNSASSSSVSKQSNSSTSSRTGTTTSKPAKTATNKSASSTRNKASSAPLKKATLVLEEEL